MLATTRELANKHNLTYSQARYLIDQGVINPAPAKEGQAWELSDRDLWIFELAALLRNKKMGIKDVKYIVHAIRDRDQTELMQWWFVNQLEPRLFSFPTALIEWDKVKWVVYVGIESFEAMRSYANGVNVERYKMLSEADNKMIAEVEAPGKQ